MNKKVIAYTLELPWRGNAPLVSSIPTGSYGGTLRYDHADRWRVQLTNVPNRSNIQIHIGNKVEDTHGCVLVGTGIAPDLCSLIGGSSKAALDALRFAFYGTNQPVATPDKVIRVVVQD